MNSFIKFSAIITACAAFLFSAHTETAFAADGDSLQLAPMTPAPLELGRGVNVLGYDPIWNNFEQRRFKAEYFTKIKEAGFDHLRLNIHPFRHQLGADEGYRMKDEWYKTLDWIVDNALRNDLKIILDLHEYNAMSEDPEGNRERFLSFWRQMSDKFSGYSNRVVFELLNEPHNKLDAKLWNVYAKDALAVIREKNPERPVIIGATQWNSINLLHTLELPADDPNIMVTVHYYKPMRFTHQGASWVGEELRNTSGVTWGTDEEKAAVVKDFEEARKWGVDNNRIVYLGEFGAYDKAPTESRVTYTDYVCRTCEKMGWSWGYWQFDSDFIVFDVKNDKWVEPILGALIPNSPVLK